jgi:hypothetical protein
MTLQDFLDQARAARKADAEKLARGLTLPELEKVHGELVAEWNKWMQSDLLDYITAIRSEHATRLGGK